MLFKPFMKSTALILSVVLLGSTASQAGRIALHLEENEQTKDKTYSYKKKIGSDAEITTNSSNASAIRSHKTRLIGGHHMFSPLDLSMSYLGMGFVRPVSNQVDDKSSSREGEESYDGTIKNHSPQRFLETIEPPIKYAYSLEYSLIRNKRPNSSFAIELKQQF